MLFTCYEYIISEKTVSTPSTLKNQTSKTEKQNTNNNKKQKHISISNVQQFDATFDKRDKNI